MQKANSIPVKTLQEGSIVLPSEPGCYLFKDPRDKILYIGKAKNLKHRIKSYFQDKTQDKKTRSLVEQIHFIDYIITENEKESLILENNLIKKYQPKYNIDLKDGKSYSYIKISREPIPTISVVRNKSLKGEYFGPFISAADRNSILNIITNLFKIRTCKRMSKKACLRFQIGLCSAPCIENISPQEYSDRINSIRMILKGKISQLVKSLKVEMIRQAGVQNFEEALEMRDQINALQNLLERQNMERIKRTRDEDIINYILQDDKVYLMIFNIDKGLLLSKAEFVLDYNSHEEDGETGYFFEEFLQQFYSKNKIPAEIIIPHGISESLVTDLEMWRGKRVKVIQPKRGEKRKLLDLVKKNIQIHFFPYPGILSSLQAALSLPLIPHTIECFDVSHLAGFYTTASMVQFYNGKPQKGKYRRFRLKTVSGIDDYQAIAEVVERRYTRLINEKKSLPDLIIIDGGPGQLGAALKVLSRIDLSIPVVSLAKRLEEIYLPGAEKPVRLKKTDRGLKMLQQIRDEAHRFAVKYHKILRKKGLTAKDSQ